MTLIAREPWGLLDQFHNELNNALRSNRADTSTHVVTSDWTPAVDIREEDHAFILLADLPGIDTKDIEITMDKGSLTISGHRNAVVKEEKDGYKRVERVSGSFKRRFNLPDSIDTSAISASSNNGVLEVVLPKVEPEQPVRIEIKDE